jgi:radical SAM protein with 4Fe4S-binding SPASM domain
MICEHTNIDDNNFFESIFDAQVKSGKLYTSTIELTERCNFSCIHCYNRPKDITCTKDLTLTQLKKLIDGLVEMECLFLVITGGEPLVHKDFRELWEYAYKQGLLITLFTNGLLIDDDLIEFFRKYPPYSVEVTMYGFSDKTYEKITGRKKIFDIVKRNIVKLKKEHFTLYVKAMVMNGNLEDIVKIYQWNKNRNIEFRYDTHLSPTIAGDDKTDLMISADEIMGLAKSIDESNEDVNVVLEKASETVRDYHTGDNLYSCGAGRASVYIDSTGGVHPCVYHRTGVGNLLERPLAEILKNDIKEAVSEKIVDKETLECRNCKDAFYCGWCPAIEQTASLNLTTRSRWRAKMCRAARIRKEYFEGKGLEIQEIKTPGVGYLENIHSDLL